jgi:hypothetical protein
VSTEFVNSRGQQVTVYSSGKPSKPSNKRFAIDSTVDCLNREEVEDLITLLTEVLIRTQ